MRPSSIAIAGPALLLALFISSCSAPGPSTARSVRPVEERKTAPDFELRDANGAPIRLSDYRGKVVLLDFWATWCGPCKVEIPWFIEFQRKHKDRGLEVLGVSMDEDGWNAVKPFVAQRGVNYRVVLGDNKTADAYGGLEALPTTFLIDREGRVASVHVGLAGKEEFENAIKTLLESPGSGRAAGHNAALLLARSN